MNIYLYKWGTSQLKILNMGGFKGVTSQCLYFCSQQKSVKKTRKRVKKKKQAKAVTIEPPLLDTYTVSGHLP